MVEHSNERPARRAHDQYDDLGYVMREIQLIRGLRDADQRVFAERDAQTVLWRRSVDERLTALAVGVQEMKIKLAERRGPLAGDLGIGGGLGIGISFVVYLALKSLGVSLP